MVGFLDLREEVAVIFNAQQRPKDLDPTCFAGWLISVPVSN